MGRVEKAAKGARRLGQVERAILGAVAVAGVLSLAVVAPNTLALLKYIPSDKYKFGHRTRIAAYRLAEKGLIIFVERGGKKSMELTARGEEMVRIEKAKLAFSQNRPKRWDTRWRMVIFDIPERRRRVRDQFRITMQEIGFLKIQDSVWVYPYDCEDLVTMLKVELGLGGSVVYAIVERFEDERTMRKHFKLAGE